MAAEPKGRGGEENEKGRETCPAADLGSRLAWRGGGSPWALGHADLEDLMCFGSVVMRPSRGSSLQHGQELEEARPVLE